MKKNTLSVSNLTVSVEGKEVVNGISLNIEAGKLHVIMGPNGSGKSSLVYAMAGHPSYEVRSEKLDVRNKKAKIILNGKDVTDTKPEERAKGGLMLAFQNPVTIPGVSINNFLRTAYQELHGKKNFSALAFHKTLLETMKQLKLPEDFLRRAVNDGFSGGEKKKLEMLQLLVLGPKYAIFDEIDTGLDVDALKSVSQGIDVLKQKGVGILLITHYQRILQFLTVDRVHIMMKGKLVKEGGIRLIDRVEKEGYEQF